MSFRTLVIAFIFLAVFGMAARPSMDSDTWWHLRTGEVIVQERSIPANDSFSFTRNGEAWRYPSTAWFAEAQLFLIYDAFGAGGLNLWVAAAVTLAFVFVYFAMSGPPLLRAFVLVLAAAVSGIYWAARPYMLSFVLAALFHWILEDYRWRRANRLIWLPVLMILWVNSHPGFGIGLILLAVYVAEQLAIWLFAKWRKNKKTLTAASRQLRPLPLVGLGLLVAICINPSGPAALAYPFETISIGELRDFIQEWQSPNFHSLQAQPFAWLLLLTLGVLAAAGRPIALSDFLLIAGFAYLGLLAGRNIPLFALAAPVVLTRYAAPWLEDLRSSFGIKRTKLRPDLAWQRWINVALVAVLAFAVVARASASFPAKGQVQNQSNALPLGAIEYLQSERPTGRMFNSYNWGGYLIWALREYPVYIDGRTDLYADGLLAEWLETVRAEDGWQQTLDRWQIGLVLLEPTWPLTKLLPTEGWQLLYEDEVSMLFGR